MEHLLKETLGRYAMLAGTYSKGDETGNDWIWNWDWVDILQRRKIIEFHTFFHFFQE